MTATAPDAPSLATLRAAPTRAPRLGWVSRIAREKVLEGLARLSRGRLSVVLPDGRRVEAGEGEGGPRATLFVREERFFARVARRGRLGLGEAFVDGDWTADDLTAVLELGIRNRAAARPASLARWAHRLLPRRLENDRAGSRRNVRAHYDLGNAFYALWLDPSMTYSSAVFARPDEPLESAQERKLDLMADKACIRKGDRVLEIGCGWGSFAVRAASRRDCRVTGLTVSEAQHAHARERVRATGLEDRVDVRLEDYRDAKGRFDAVVSIEMLEAVGRRFWPAYFESVDRLLAEDGVASIQVICHPDQGFEAYAARTDWIERHVFPGSLLGSLGAFASILADRTRLRIHHVEDVGMHYARTLRAWRERFHAAEAGVRALGFDDRFLRTWTYYLCMSEAAFRTRHLLDLQLVLVREGNDRLPEFPRA